MGNHIYEASYKQCKVGIHSYEVLYNPQSFNYTNKQYKVGSHSYEAPYSLLFYDYTNKLCRMVDEQILLVYCIRNKSKQRQYVARIQVLFGKTT